MRISKILTKVIKKINKNNQTKGVLIFFIFFITTPPTTNHEGC